MHAPREQCVIFKQKTIIDSEKKNCVAMDLCRIQLSQRWVIHKKTTYGSIFCLSFEVINKKTIGSKRKMYALFRVNSFIHHHHHHLSFVFISIMYTIVIIIFLLLSFRSYCKRHDSLAQHLSSCHIQSRILTHCSKLKK